MSRWLPILAFLALGGGCAPAIGDSCSSDLDCSLNNDRVCDRARPFGACTVYGCEADNCPDDAVCVRWRPEPSRLTFTACMRRCDNSGGCRADEGYDCLSPADLVAPNGDALVEIVDQERPEGSFCVATEPEPPEEE